MVTKRSTPRHQDSAGSVVKVRRIVNANVPVYDLTVDLHHCYYANGMLVSNSDAWGLVAIFRQGILVTQDNWGTPIRRNLRGIV
jgi:hypothetical protein